MLYLNHFGLTEPPFAITPDTAFAFATRSHQEALNTLLVALGSGEGFIKIVGEVGVGKTLLCRRLMDSLGPDYVLAYIPNPYLEPETLLREVAEELKIRLRRGPKGGFDQYEMLKALKGKLLHHAREGRRVVICIDEAQAMPLRSLEVLRLLSNFETEKQKLLHVVLFGQPELDAKLAHESVRQIRQRITFEYRLNGLAPGELALYLAHRLQVAGLRGQSLFSAHAVVWMQRFCRGVPRRINILAHKALLAAYGEGAHEVGTRHVLAAARDSRQGKPLWRSLPRWVWALSALSALSALATGGVLMGAW